MTTTAASAEQIELLLQFMQEHQNLARGRLLRDIEGKAVAQQQWTSLTNLLNGVGGAHKTTKQWQKVWADKKYLAKKAAAASNRSAKQTGGGPPSAPELSQMDQRIVNILGEGFGLPDTQVVTNPFPSMEASTSAVGLTIHNNSQQESPSILGDLTTSCEFQLDRFEAVPSMMPYTNPLSAPIAPETAASTPTPICSPAVNAEASATPSAPAARSTTSATPVAAPSSSRMVNAETTLIRPAAPAATSTTASATPVQRRRLRRSAPLVEDVRTRLFRLEEEKQKEMVRIRMQLEKLTDALTSALIELRRINNNN